MQQLVAFHRSPAASRRWPGFCLALALLLGAAPAGVAQTAPSFTSLPLDVTGYFAPSGVAADGKTVVGGSYILGSGNQARRWRQGLGFDYPGPSVGPIATWCSGCSSSGSVVAGGSGHAVFGDLEGWMRYGTSVGHVGSPSGHDTSDCLAVSADGVVTAGYGGVQSNPNLFQAARYTEQGDWVNMGFLPGGNNSKATGASADGSVLVGWSNDAALSIARAFRWTAATGMVSLGNLPGGDDCRATGVNGDGSVVVGSDYVVDAQFNSTETAWRWTAATGMVSLGQLPGGQASVALAVSPDGTVVVGTADQAGGYVAFVWDAAHGMRALRDVLIAQGVPGLANWELVSATCIAGSAPYWIAGEGGSPQPNSGGWVAHVDPKLGAVGTWVSLGSGLAGTAGVPLLAGTGPLTGGSSVTVQLSSARASAAALLMLSAASTPVAFKGGVLLAFPFLASLPIATSPAGSFTLPISPWPSGLPSGLAIVWQIAVQDPAAVQGVALSNGLQSTLP